MRFGRWTAVVAAALTACAGPAFAQITEDGEPDSSRSRCADLAGARGDAPESAPWAGAPLLEGPAAQDPKAWAKTTPVVVKGAKLAGRSLRGLKLTGVCFEDSDLSGADLTGAVLTRTAFVRSDLSRAVLKGRFERAAFVSSVLDGADAGGADWTGATVKGGVFSGLNLRGAALRRFTLDCTDNAFMYGDRCTDSWITTGEERTPEPVDARGADLTEARFAFWDGGWRMDGARIDRTEVELDDAPHLRGARLDGPVRIEAALAPGGRIELSAADWRALEAAWLTPAAVDAAPRAPSFDCAAAASRVERMICDGSDYGELAGLDRSLASAYARASQAGAANGAGQRAWLKSRDACADRACVATAYRARIEVLRRRIAPGSVPEAGREAVFISAPPPVDPAFAAGPLYARLAPAILGGYGNVLYVKGLGGGRVEAAGEGVWFNGHTCSLEPRVYRLDPKTGWLVGEGSAPVLRVLGAAAEVSAEGGDHAGCGARGSWAGDLHALPVAPADTARLRAALFAER